MRLKKIKLAGFKSFVDPTTIDFPSQLVGVVGPNGCGKSNVIDAVRWVMGESSAKQLRGESLTDVIFNGSSGRKPVGQASVDLVFDNSAGTLGGEYAQYSEISVKRQLSRDGKSVYFLNGTRCRRRDITDIFLGTGLGPRSYAIIEQGTISRLIEAKPEELRVFLEEAAGVSKYKERRRETENRIKVAKENISRIDDLVLELEKRLNVLNRQAKTAERYKKLKEEERLLKAQLLALRWRALDSDAAEQNKQIQGKETQFESQMAALRAVESEIESLRDGLVEDNEQFNKVQGEFYAIGSEIARLEQSIEHAKEKRQQQQQEFKDVEQAWLEAQVHQKHDNGKIEEITGSLATIDPELALASETEQAAAERLTCASDAMNEWQNEWDTFNTEAASQMQALEVERNRIIHLESQLEQLRNRHEKSRHEQQALDFTELEQETETLNAEGAEISGVMEGIQNELHALRSHVSEQRDANAQLSNDANHQRHELMNLQKQHASLEALQIVALGKEEENVTEWLDQHALKDATRLAEKLQVESGWETAVETVLGSHLEALCVDGFASLDSSINEIEKGSLSFFDTAAAQCDPQSHKEAATLLSKVSSPWAIDSLLSGIYVVETISDALALQGSLGQFESIVTRDGLWLGRDWLRVSRTADEKTGVLVREQELTRLAEEIHQMATQLDVIEEQMHVGNSALKAFEDQRNQLQEQLNEITRRHTDVRSRVSSNESKLDQLRNRAEKLHGEISDMQSQMELGSDEISHARGKLEELLGATEGHQEQREGLSQLRDELRESLEAHRDQARQYRDSARELVMKKSNLQSQCQALNENLIRMENQLAHLGKRREDLDVALSISDSPIEEMQGNLQDKLEQRLIIENQLGEARKMVESVEFKLRELSSRRNETEQSTQAIRSELEQLKLSFQSVKVRRQTLEEQVSETKYSLELLFEAMPEGANVVAWEEEVEQLSLRISRLGPINLAAIDEYTEQSERKTYLDQQLEDLNKALNTLEDAIRKIDHETRSLFKDTFDQVNEKLQEFFPKLFGGGLARLELSGDDLLTAGVNIVARPPGKRNSSIHLLSGGEKALTAVALVFAFFELNPAPFCMLDEVDAPLDDNNTIRFSKMVEEMSDRVQFIFITHNKITMEVSKQLIGVTMHEPGVSRTVAVDIDNAVQLSKQ